ncbi:hypothetical protein ACP4OV_009479 [Aristida adscensionis]
MRAILTLCSTTRNARGANSATLATYSGARAAQGRG